MGSKNNKPVAEIQRWRLEDLVPYERNARTHSPEQVEKIAKSLQEFGWMNPILLDGTEGNIIAGHGRLMAAKLIHDRGMTINNWPDTGTAAVIVHSHLTPQQKRAYVLADNRLALDAGWDSELLAAELEDLKLDDFDISVIGFSEDELDGMFDVEVVPEGKTDEDACGEPPAEPVTRLGDVWALGNHRLMCGDSTSVDAVDSLMEGNKADMVFTDPPYGVSYEGGHNKKKRQGIIADTLEGDDLTGLFYGALAAALACTKDGAAFYVWYASGKSIETFASLAQMPLTLRAVIQWYKIKSGLGAFMSQYIPNCEPCMYLHKTGCSPAWYGPTNEKTVWELKKEPKNEYHPTQKPVELPERAITNSSKQGDEILDLFGGSGSTMIACEKIGRHARLMELDPKYCDVIVKRYEQFTGKNAILESSGKTFEQVKNEKGL
jgi:DNA modification methylase